MSFKLALYARNYGSLKALNSNQYYLLNSSCIGNIINYSLILFIVIKTAVNN